MADEVHEPGGTSTDRSDVITVDQQIRVLIVDDHELLTTSLQAAFAQDGRTTVVGTAGSLADGVRAAAALRPDVVLADRRLPDGDMDEHVLDLRTACPTARLIMMTGWPTQRSSLEALDAGVDGIISKSQPVAQMLEAIARVMVGDLVVPVALRHVLLARSGRSDIVHRNDLSRRELDVLEALARGQSTVDVAHRLRISHNTVRNHLARAMLKLGVHNRISAVSEAIHLGLISPPLPSDQPAVRQVASW